MQLPVQLGWTVEHLVQQEAITSLLRGCNLDELRMVMGEMFMVDFLLLEKMCQWNQGKCCGKNYNK